jgi:RNA polymerase sigma factor (sigma-70 family)
MSTGTAVAHNLDAVARTKRNLLVTVAANTASRVVAEDAVQAAFMTAWIKQDQRNEGGDTIAYMVAMTRYHAMALRPGPKKAKQAIPVDFAAAWGEPGHVNPMFIADRTTDPASRYEDEDDPRATQRRQLAAEALSVLTPRERQLVQMHWMNGMECVDIAKDLGIRQSSVENMLKRSGKKMRRHFGEPETRPRPPARPVDPEQLTEGARARAAEAARLRLNEKLTHREIGERMGVHPRRARGYLADARALGLLA